MADAEDRLAFGVNSKGGRLVKEYERAGSRVKNAECELSNARMELLNARDALVKWCAPLDARPGEKFAIWARDQHGNEVLVEVQTAAPGPVGGLAGDPVESSVNFRYRK